MKTRRKTAILMVVTAFVWLAWDIFVASNSTPGDTESEITRDYTIYPALPALLGGLLGHWTFWEVRLGPDPWGMIGCILCIFLLIGWSALTKNNMGPQTLINIHMFASRHPVLVVATSYIIGGVLWGLPPSEKTLG